MNYEQRKRLISGWLFETLKRYEVPSHFDENASRQEMVLMVEDMNSEIPKLNEGSIKLLLEKTAQHVRKNYTSRRWPTINSFIKGIKENRDSITNAYVAELPPPEENQGVLSYGDAIIVKRVKTGEPIADYLLDPQSAHRRYLVENSDLQDSDFHKYVAPMR